MLHWEPFWEPSRAPAAAPLSPTHKGTPVTITRPTPAPAAPAWLVELAPRIRIVFCDLDDTLLDACHQVPARTAQVVRRLHRCGVRFSPATGRTVPALRGLFGSLSDEIDFVAGNGTDVSVDGCTIYHAPYPRAAALELFDAVKGSRQRLGFVTFDETGPHLASVEADFVRAHVESLRHAPVCPDELLFAGRELGKVGVVVPQGAAAGVEELEQAVGDLFSFAPTGPYWIDVLVRGIDKAQGIDRMLVHLGIDPSEALAFGDSMNDVAMMELLPNTVAVSNAMPELKRLCAHEIGSNLDEAVLDCLDQLCELRERRP